MYRIEQEAEAIQLISPEGFLAEILPACGALLNRFSAPSKEGALNVIEGFAQPALACEQIKPAFQSAKLSPFVCRIREARYSYKDTDYALEKFILNGSAIHGLVFDEPFTVKRLDAGPDQASAEMLFEYRGTDPGYPFDFDCLVRYILKGASVTLETEVVNKDNSSLPLADGWHPYFTLCKPLDELELQFHAPEILEFEHLLPTGRQLPYTRFQQLEKIGGTELDNAFVLSKNAPSPACILRDPSTGVQVEISPDASYPILQIYTPPHRLSIAIENLSGAPDNFNNGIGLLELEPGEMKKFSTTYTIRLA